MASSRMKTAVSDAEEATAWVAEAAAAATSWTAAAPSWATEIDLDAVAREGLHVEHERVGGIPR